MKYILLLITSIVLISCKVQNNTYKPVGDFKSDTLKAPDYSKLDFWVAHPDKKDYADSVPGNLVNNQGQASADVFFVYPTIYTGNVKGQENWNANVYDEELNEKIGKSTILNQASVFNGSTKVYAPLYRQAHINVYFETANREAAKKAFDLAYRDVRTAFLYYMKNYNKGRPFILASHSQGTNHSERLLREFFSDEHLRSKLIAAYLIGMPINADSLQLIPPCQSATQTGCFVSWNAYARGYYPDNWKYGLKYATATNPLNWVTNDTYADYEENKGSVLSKFTIKENLVDAQVVDGMVWLGKPNIFGGAFLNRKRWHFAEYNLYYINIRENISDRVSSYMEKKSSR